MTPSRPGHLLIVLAAGALLALAAGCGSDSSGETSTDVSVSVPTVTSPLAPTTTTATPTQTEAAKQKPAKTTTSTGGSSAPCQIPDAYQDFKFTGTDCAGAVAVAQAWDADGKDCNTVDNPNVAAGYHRTCTVEGYSCTAKRDVHSDARFVSCSQGAGSIRFTWLPA